MHFNILKEQLKLVSKETDVELLNFYSLFWKKMSFLTSKERIEVLHLAKPYSTSTPKLNSLHTFSEGGAYTFNSEYSKGIDTLTKTIELFSEINEKAGIGAVNSLLIICYRSLGQFEKAQSSIQQAIEALKNSDSTNIFHHFLLLTYYQAGEMNVISEKYDLAIEYYHKGLGLIKDNNLMQARMLNGLGGVYLKTSHWQKAFDYFNKSLELTDQDNFMLTSKNYSDLAEYYLKNNNIDEALLYQKKSLKIRVENNFWGPAITSYIQLAEIFFLQKDVDQAIKYGQLAVEKAKGLNLIPKLFEAHRILSNVYEYIGDIALELEHLKNYYKNREEVHNQEVTRKIEQLNSKHEIEIMQQHKEIFRLKNVELKSAIDELNESFRYARRIQEAILPPMRLFNKHLPDSFILYKPKDIVAGDFYWMEPISLDKDNDQRQAVLFAAADCTGHGVPGAMVSVVCHNALNRAIREFKLSSPGAILDKITDLIIEQFEKSEDEVKDGMDIALCRLHGNKLQYAGANNSLWLIRKNLESETNQYKIIEIKADKQPVGKYVHRTPFVNHELDLLKGDTIYLFSDGFADQFGGEKGKKFMNKQLKELLLSIQEKTLEEQKIVLDSVYENWKGKLEQVDDVCIVGVKV